jgi:hypothetical protein
MIAVIYKFKLKPHHEAEYMQLWLCVATYFKQQRGALGSSLHKGDDGDWMAYSRWPDEATRDASWPDDNAPSDELPDAVRAAIFRMQEMRKENEPLGEYQETTFEVVEDML